MNTPNETSTDPGTKSAAEIERDVHASRARVEQTLDQIQDRLSPGQLIDQTVTYLRDGGGGEFARNLGESVKQNPLPVALIAAGVGWMMLGGHQYRSNGDSEPTDWDDHHDRFGEPYVGLAERHPTYAGFDAPGADTTSASGAASDLGDRLKDTARDAKDSLGALGDETRERIADAGSDAADRARHLRERARQRSRRVKQSVLQTINEQPLILGAIGLAIGAALGAAVPPSEVEDRLMGETRDEALRRAEEVGREQAEKARDAAATIAAAARDEAEALTPDAEPEADRPASV